MGSFGFPFTICTHYFPLSFLFCFCSTILSQLIFYFISSVLYLVYFTFCLFRYTCESIPLDTIHNLRFFFPILLSFSLSTSLLAWVMGSGGGVNMWLQLSEILVEKFKFLLLFWNPVPRPSVSKLFSELCTFPWKTRFAVFLPLNVRACCHKDLFLPVLFIYTLTMFSSKFSGIKGDSYDFTESSFAKCSFLH